jgi:uncharacterized membrane protein YoaK (UPF0700 family)
VRAPRRRRRLRLLYSAAAHRRSAISDEILGTSLAFIAGAINAGGFLAVGQYTSHMTGVVSAIADNLVLGVLGLVGTGLVALVSFGAGSACSAMLINWGRRNARRRQYAYPIGLEAVLLLVFGAIGAAAGRMPGLMLLAAPLLCFIMGLQNATITKISGARMRTTHLTGMVTDIGIELGKLAYWNRDRRAPELMVMADRRKLGILLRVVGMFFSGGVIGALGFGQVGYGFSVPLALLLMSFAVASMRPVRPRSALASPGEQA